MRWLAVLVVAAVGVALGAAGLLLLRDDGPEALLPDLDQLPPAELEIVAEGDTYRLTFASAVDNVGAGPLVVEGERTSREVPAMAVRQLVRRSDGSFRPRDVPGEIRFADSGEAGRWQLLGFEAYELRRANDGTVVRKSEEAGSCLGDRHEAVRQAQAADGARRAVWTEQCGRDRPEILTLRQGISPGFGADSGLGDEGPALDLTNVPAGRYVLVHRVNPRRTLEEGGYENNAASVLIQLRRDGQVPSVRVLARCPDGETCAPGQAR
jgi:hypothetical protein